MTRHPNDRADRIRLESLWSAHYDAVFAFARRRTDETRAAEVAAEVFTVAWRRLDDVPAAPLGWLLGVARRTIANDRRGARRRLALFERLSDHRVDPLLHSDGHSDILIALATLGANDRDALLLVAWEGLTSDEAATAMGCSRTTFNVRIHRARQRLRRALDRAIPETTAPPTAEEAR